MNIAPTRVEWLCSHMPIRNPFEIPELPKATMRMPSLPDLCWDGDDYSAETEAREIAGVYAGQGHWDDGKAHWRPHLTMNRELFGIVKYYADRKRVLPQQVMFAVEAALNMTAIADDQLSITYGALIEAAAEIQKRTGQPPRGHTAKYLAEGFDLSERAIQERRALPEYHAIKQSWVDFWLERSNSIEPMRIAANPQDDIEVVDYCERAVQATRDRTGNVPPEAARRVVYLIALSQTRNGRVLGQSVLIALAVVLQVVDVKPQKVRISAA